MKFAYILGLILIVNHCFSQTVGSITDTRDGVIYKTVKIGSKTWMAENLKATKYLDGSPIFKITDDKAWVKSEAGAYCDYENNLDTLDLYGKLYNWYVVENSRGICPKGWHVPTHNEWQNLIDFYGGEKYCVKKLKEAGDKHWKIPNTESKNESGFNAIPGGLRGEEGKFYDKGEVGYWWSSISSGEKSYEMELKSEIKIGYLQHTKGLSIRCLKNP